MTYAVTKGGHIVPSHTADDSVYRALKRTLGTWSRNGQRDLAWALVADALFDARAVDVAEQTEANGDVRVVTFTLARRARG
jgi:hypothetical protein